VSVRCDGQETFPRIYPRERPVNRPWLKTPPTPGKVRPLGEWRGDEELLEEYKWLNDVPYEERWRRASKVLKSVTKEEYYRSRGWPLDDSEAPGSTASKESSKESSSDS